MTKERTRARTPNNKTTTGFRISDELWEVLQPLLPEHRNTHPLGGGRPRRPDRECADAIFYVLPVTSSTASSPFRARSARSCTVWWISRMDFRSAWRITGTMSPSSRATATPM